MNARSLHRQLTLGRTIRVIEQADLHLLYYSDIIFIKPLPAYILQKQVWDDFLCKDSELHESACGLLLSYVWLIRSPSDFQVAKQPEISLLPEDLEWIEWKRIVHRSLAYINTDTLEQVNKRFHFGELKLRRINSIFSIHHKFFPHFVRGYWLPINKYNISQNITWLITFSVLLTTCLSALQVGIAINPLQSDKAFLSVTFVIVAFSMFIVAIVTVVALSFVFISCYDMVAAIRSALKWQRIRRKAVDDCINDKTSKETLA
jgi:hypothetical protein